jgi:RNA polymerase sigma factor (sigma-70 family)
MTDWTNIVAAHGAALTRVVASYSPPGQDREDLAQEVAFMIVRALPRHRGDASLKTYILRIAHNVGLRHAVRYRRYSAEPVADIPSEQGGPAELVMEKGERSRLHAAIRRLPIAQRQVLALRLEDLTHGEIAGALQITENAVATRLHRARARLKILLEEP